MNSTEQLDYNPMKLLRRLADAEAQVSELELRGKNCYQVPKGRGFCINCENEKPELCLYTNTAGALCRITELERELKDERTRYDFAVWKLERTENKLKDTVTVEYNLSPARTEAAIRGKLIELGWTPPEKGNE